MWTVKAEKRLRVFLLLVVMGGVFLCDAGVARADFPLKMIREKSKYYEIDVAWPVTGFAALDKKSEADVRRQVRTFKRYERAERKEARSPFQLAMGPQVTTPSKRVFSILWTMEEHVGGAHGNIATWSGNYDRRTGKTLGLKDLFEQPDKALGRFSDIARKTLAEEGLDKEWLNEGTQPKEENFRLFTVTPDGIELRFAAYQVANWANSFHSVTVSLDDLNEAKPRLVYWGK